MCNVVVQEHYVLLLGGAIFLELAGAALFLANYSAGAYMLVRSCIAEQFSVCRWAPIFQGLQHLMRLQERCNMI